MCSCNIFGSPRKDERWCVFIKELSLLLKNSYAFLLHPSLLESLMCSRNLFKKVTPGKKQIFSKIARRLLLIEISLTRVCLNQQHKRKKNYCYVTVGGR